MDGQVGRLPSGERELRTVSVDAHMTQDDRAACMNITKGGVSEISGEAFGEQCAERRSQLPAGVDVRAARLADDRDGVVRGAPVQSRGDDLYRIHGTGGVVVPVNVEAIGTATRRIEARIVDLVEEVLQGA